jgi:basic membrane protein A
MIPRARVSCIALFAVVFALAAAGCGSSSSSSSEPEASSIKVALITDIGGLNDKGFNALAYQGLQEAKTKYGSRVAR